MSSALFCVPAGTRVSNFLFPFYRHYGVVMENGLVMSCSARTGRAMEETFAVFAGGQKWRVEKPPSDMPWWVVVQRARYFSDRGITLPTGTAKPSSMSALDCRRAATRLSSRSPLPDLA